MQDTTSLFCQIHILAANIKWLLHLRMLAVKQYTHDMRARQSIVFYEENKCLYTAMSGYKSWSYLSLTSLCIALVRGLGEPNDCSKMVIFFRKL